MKILTSLKAGFKRSVRSGKGIILIWLVSLILVSLVAIPMKSALKADLGSSMITEKMTKGINIEVFADLGTNLKNLVSYFSGGLFIVIIVVFFMNSFLSGGLFNCLRSTADTFSYSEFFRTSAKYFWSFTIISVVLSLIILFAAIILIIIPVSIVSNAEVSSEGLLFKTAVVSISSFLLVLAILYIVADYARAWQVSNEKIACFKALGFGFRHSIKTFFSSYPLMLILSSGQLVYAWFALSFLQGLKPGSETGIIFLFLVAQLLFIFKLFLKVLRYGSLTNLMEISTHY
jgi:hypothetical protein